MDNSDEDATQMRICDKIFEIILSCATPLSNNCWYCARTSFEYTQITSNFKITSQNHEEVFTNTTHCDLSLFRSKPEIFRFIVDTTIIDFYQTVYVP